MMFYHQVYFLQPYPWWYSLHNFVRDRLQERGAWAVFMTFTMICTKQSWDRRWVRINILHLSIICRQRNMTRVPHLITTSHVFPFPELEGSGHLGPFENIKRPWSPKFGSFPLPCCMVWVFQGSSVRHNLQLMLAAFIVASIASCGGALLAFTVVRVLQPSWMPLPLSSVTCRWLGLEPDITVACEYIYCSHECILYIVYLVFGMHGHVMSFPSRISRQSCRVPSLFGAGFVYIFDMFLEIWSLLMAWRLDPIEG